MELIETILWEKGRFFLIKPHVERLARSACHFSFSCDADAVVRSLEKAVEPLDENKKYRIRLLLKRSGKTGITVNPLDTFGTPPLKTAISEKKTDTHNDLLYHKTTERRLYDDALKKCRADGLFDVIFTNQNNEITEGAVSNVMIRKNGAYWTPPVCCGLLAGVYRQYLLSSVPGTEGTPLKEKVLYPSDLHTADAIFMINSVRKIVPVLLVS
ncbi:MAG: aminotransferase class IV [Candidatus Omnitrophota bacterium]